MSAETSNSFRASSTNKDRRRLTLLAVHPPGHRARPETRCAKVRHKGTAPVALLSRSRTTFRGCSLPGRPGRRAPETSAAGGATPWGPGHDRWQTRVMVLASAGWDEDPVVFFVFLSFF